MPFFSLNCFLNKLFLILKMLIANMVYFFLNTYLINIECFNFQYGKY